MGKNPTAVGDRSHRPFCPVIVNPTARNQPSPLSAQTGRDFLLYGDFSAFLDLEKIPQPDDFLNMYC
jgi:hypothetical protein